MPIVAGGGGSGLPSQWTVDEATGNVLIEALAGAFGQGGLGGLLLRSSDDNAVSDVLMVQTQNGSTTFGLDPFGGMVGANLALGVDNTAAGAAILKAIGSAVGDSFFDYFQVKASNTDLFRIVAGGGILMSALPTADPHVAGQLYSLAGTLHVSAG